MWVYKPSSGAFRNPTAKVRSEIPSDTNIPEPSSLVYQLTSNIASRIIPNPKTMQRKILNSSTSTCLLKPYDCLGTVSKTPSTDQGGSHCACTLYIGRFSGKFSKHLGMWAIKARPPTKRANGPPLNIHIDSSHSQIPPSEVYPPLEGLSLLRSGLVRLRRIIPLRCVPLEDPVSGGDNFKKALGSNGPVYPALIN